MACRWTVIRVNLPFKNFNPVYRLLIVMNMPLLQRSDLEQVMNKLRPQTEIIWYPGVFVALLNESKAPWPELPALKLKPGESNEALPLFVMSYCAVVIYPAGN